MCGIGFRGRRRRNRFGRRRVGCYRIWIDHERDDEGRGVGQILAGSGLNRPLSWSASQFGFNRDRPGLPMRHYRARPDIAALGHPDVPAQEARDRGAQILARRTASRGLPGEYECTWLTGVNRARISQHSQTQHRACVEDVGWPPVHATHSTPGRGAVRMPRDVVPSRPSRR